MALRSQRTLKCLTMTPQGAVRIVPFGVKDITTAQFSYVQKISEKTKVRSKLDFGIGVVQ